MDIHYNAFISYRHHPEDIRVATQIHRLLEHYRIPKTLKKQGKEIQRLFRDKEELPITSNLSDDINRALANSDYLIVICSVHTRESTWVQREIETFLKTHDRNRVLTVLVNGEPYDTIPEILLREEVTDPDNGETICREFEPLSCDWRMPLRQAKREELPRLAATLMGCGYDELRRRERQYRTRRLVAGCSAALAAMACITGYVIYNSMLIQNANDRLEQANTNLNIANISLENANAEILANYHEALINQSQYLASSSEKLLEEGDRMTAIALALEALPGYGGERPYVAEAEYALGEAVGAYESGTSLVAAGSFSCDELIKDFMVTEDGSTIYILDSRNIITVWNTYTFEKLATVAIHDDVEQMMITGAGDLLVRSYSNLLACYDREGKQLWQAEGSWTDMAFWGDRGTVILEEVLYTLAGRSCNFFVLDAQTGSVRQEILDLVVENIPYFLREIYADDSKLAMKTSSYPTYTLQLLDLENGALETLGQGYYAIYNSVTTNNGNLVLLVQKEENTGMQGNYMGITITTPEILQLQCHTSAGKLLWETNITTYCYSSFRTMEIIPGSEDILCQTGNLFLVVDSATGAVKVSSEATGYVMWTEVGAQATRAVLDSGAVGSFMYEESYCGFMPRTKDDLICVDVWGGDYYVADELSTQVTAYRYIGDENWVSIGTDGYLYPNEWHARNGLLALESYSKLQMVSPEEERPLWELSASQPEVIGFSPDGSVLWATRNRGVTLLRIDALTGDAVEIPLPETVEGISPYSGEPAELSVDIGYEDMIVCGDYVYFLGECYAEKQMYLFRCDVTTGQGAYWPLYGWDGSYGSYYYGKLVGVTDGFAVVWNQVDNIVLEFDIQTTQSRVIASDVLHMPAFREAEQGKYLLGTSDAVALRVWGGEAELNMPLADCRAVSAYMYESYILTLGDDGYLYRFDLTGKQLSKYGITRYNTYITTVESTNFDPSCITWERTADGSLILGIDGSGNLIDCTTWKSRAWIPSYYAYLENSNRVLLRDLANTYGLGTFPLYTTEDIITMALEALNGYELSDTVREAYGLD